MDVSDKKTNWNFLVLAWLPKKQSLKSSLSYYHLHCGAQYLDNQGEGKREARKEQMGEGKQM